MTHQAASSDLRAAVKRWGVYILLAALMLGVVYAVSRFLPVMPVWAVALCWGLLIGLLAIRFAYPLLINKQLKHHQYQEGSALSRVLGGKTLTLIVSFFASAMCISGLLIESQRWETPEWAIVFLSAVFFIPVYVGLQALLARQFKTQYRVSHTLRVSCLIVGLLLLVYFVALALLTTVVYATTTEAFLASPNVFQGSPSTLLVEIGTYKALVDALTDFALSQVMTGSFLGFVLAKIVLSVSAAMGVANIIGLCAIPLSELRTVFASPSFECDKEGARVVSKRYVVLFAVVPLVLAAGLFYADAKAAQAVQTEEFSAADSFVREQVGVAALVMDGKIYDYQKAMAVQEQLSADSLILEEQARETLEPLINASFDARIQNVDSYLDWYYSLTSDYERLANMIVGTADQFVAEQLEAHLEAGIDDSELEKQLAFFAEQRIQLEEGAKAALEACEIVGVPDWLVTQRSVMDPSKFYQPLAPTNKLVDPEMRIALSTGAGVVSGVVAKRVLAKLSQTTVFKAIVEKIASKLGSKAVGQIVGGAVGTIGGPVGTALGIVTGAAIGVGVDYVFLMVDEAQNRDSYRQELVDAIEAERAAMLF